MIGSKFLLELNFCKVPIGSFHQKVLKSKLLKKIDYVYGQKSSLQIYMGGNLLTVQSIEIMSYFLFFLATVFGNLEVWKVNKCNIFLKYISAGV